MAWKHISSAYGGAPRDGTVIMTIHENSDHIEFHTRWGVHRATGEERWVDSHGLGVVCTHWDYLPTTIQENRRKRAAAGMPVGMADEVTDPWYDYNDGA